MAFVAPVKPNTRRVQGLTKIHTVYIMDSREFQYALGVVEAFPELPQNEYGNILVWNYRDGKG